MENKISTSAIRKAARELRNEGENTAPSKDVHSAYEKLMAMIDQLDADLSKQKEMAFRLANML